MVKLVYIVRRRSDMTPEAFRKRWKAVHGPLVRSLAKAIRAKKYIQSHTLDTPLNAQFVASRSMSEPFDGITEVWWDSLEDLVAASSTPEGAEAMQKLLEDERDFVDFGKSTIFMTEEHPIFDFK